MRQKRNAPQFGAGSSKSPLKKGRQKMSYEKFKQVSIPRELLEQFVISQLWAMRLVPAGAEIINIEGIPNTPHFPIKIKIKEVDNGQTMAA